MTERLYYTDSMLREFTARVVAHAVSARGPAVRLVQPFPPNAHPRSKPARTACSSASVIGRFTSSA